MSMCVLKQKLLNVLSHVSESLFCLQGSFIKALKPVGWEFVAVYGELVPNTIWRNMPKTSIVTIGQVGMIREHFRSPL